MDAILAKKERKRKEEAKKQAEQAAKDLEADEKRRDAHAHLISRQTALAIRKSALEAEREPVLKLIQASRVARDAAIDEEVIRVQKSLAQQHEDRVKEIKKASRCDCDEVERNLQETLDEIDQNDAEIEESLQKAEFDDELRIVNAVKEEPKQDKESIAPTPPTKTGADGRHQDHSPERNETPSVVPFDRSLTGSQSAEIDARAEADSDEESAAAIVTDAVTTIDPEEGSFLSVKFPMVIKISGQWRALHCFKCKANALNNGKLYNGVSGLLSHILISHKDITKEDMSRDARLRRCWEDKDQTFDAEDVALMRAGKMPASGQIVVVPQENQVNKKEEESTAGKVKQRATAKARLSEPAKPKPRQNPARLATRKTTAVVSPPSSSSMGGEDHLEIRERPSVGGRSTGRLSRLPQPSPSASRAHTSGNVREHRARRDFDSPDKAEIQQEGRRRATGRNTTRAAAEKKMFGQVNGSGPFKGRG